MEYVQCMSESVLLQRELCTGVYIMNEGLYLVDVVELLVGLFGGLVHVDLEEVEHGSLDVLGPLGLFLREADLGHDSVVVAEADGQFEKSLLLRSQLGLLTANLLKSYSFSVCHV